ncbi:MAG: COG1470 family protein [Chloroflexota bacterium]
MRKLVAVALVCALLGSSLGIVLPGSDSTVLAADRSVVLSTTYPSVTTGKGKEVSFPIVVHNKGSVDEWLKLEITTAPDGWTPTLKDAGFVVREVFVPATESQTVTLSMTPPADTKAGDYQVNLKASSGDGQVSSTLAIKVGISEDVSTGLKLSTQYPMLRGAPGNKFEFKLDLVNQASEDRTIDLSASAPEGWEVTFQPAYESKQLTSLRVKAGSTQGIDVQVQTPQVAVSGEYPINVKASAAGDSASVDLNVTLIGAGKLSLTTASGRLNAEANAGEETVLQALVQNTGAGDLKDVTFSASTPDGWEVTFDPAKLTELKVGAPQQVSVRIKPSAKAIAGDYVMTMRASSGTASASSDIRVTVTTSTVWGFAGVLIVGLVLVGMMGLYVRLGRR